MFTHERAHPRPQPRLELLTSNLSNVDPESELDPKSKHSPISGCGSFNTKLRQFARAVHAGTAAAIGVYHSGSYVRHDFWWSLCEFGRGSVHLGCHNFTTETWRSSNMLPPPPPPASPSPSGIIYELELDATATGTGSLVDSAWISMVSCLCTPKQHAYQRRVRLC